MTTDEPFEVRESEGMIYIIAAIFGLLFLCSLWPFFNRSLPLGERWSAMNFAVLPAIIFYLKARKVITVFSINASGLYYYGKLVTDWPGFVSAQVREEERTRGYTDNFMLYVRFRKAGEDNIYLRKFELSNVQDKSEEEIMTAIRKYAGS